MATFNPVTHVIFDLDGLLLDTERWYSVGMQNYLNRYGLEYTWETKCMLMGRSAHDVASILTKKLELPVSAEEFQEQVNVEYSKVLSNGVLMRGAEKLVKHLLRNKIPIAIASGSSNENYALKTKNHKEFFALFHHSVLSSSDPDVKHGKPNPEIFQVCASRFDENPEAERVLVFEDAVNGVQAAIAANMQVVMVPDERMDKELMKDATLVLSSLENFIPEQFGLPPYDK